MCFRPFASPRTWCSPSIAAMTPKASRPLVLATAVLSSFVEPASGQGSRRHGGGAGGGHRGDLVVLIAGLAEDLHAVLAESGRVAPDVARGFGEGYGDAGEAEAPFRRV